ECFHCPPVHPELCRVVTAYLEAGAWGLRPSAKAQYKAGAATLTMDGTARLAAFQNLNEEERRTLYVPEMVLPNLFLNIQPDYVNSHLMFPTGPQSVRIVYEWQQQGMQSREFRHGHYVPQEFDCHRFAQWVRRNLRRAR